MSFAKLADMQRERRIRALANQLKDAQEAGNKVEAHRLWTEMRAAVLSRSPEQVKRMEDFRG